MLKFYIIYKKKRLDFCKIYIYFQVIFHVATLMPTTDSDAKCNNKKKNIGNDFVTIVYNESGREYDIQTVKVSRDIILIIRFSLHM